MLRFSFRLLLAAAVVFPAACSRPTPQGGPEEKPAAGPGKPATDRASAILRARLSIEKPTAELQGPEAAELWTGLRRLYEARGYEPLWIED